jgi:hypothetical protein
MPKAQQQYELNYDDTNKTITLRLGGPNLTTTDAIRLGTALVAMGRMVESMNETTK